MALSKDEIKNLISDNLQSGTKITATKHRDIENALVDVIFALSDSFNHFVTTEALPYEVREIDMDTSFISVYFEMSGSSPGRGKTGMPFEKWAICNSYNGTRDRHGKTSIGYGFGGYNELGKTGGSENAVLIGHSHTVGVDTYPNQGGTVGLYDQATSGNYTSFNTNKVGFNESGVLSIDQSGIGKNMQPYIVTLFIQRIPTGF